MMTEHKHYCSINEVGLCSCQLAEKLDKAMLGPLNKLAQDLVAQYGPGGFPVPEPTPKLLSDDEAVQALVDVDYLASKQERIEKLRKKGIVLCRVG